MNNHLNMLLKQAKFDLRCSKMRWRLTPLGSLRCSPKPPNHEGKPLNHKFLATPLLALHGSNKIICVSYWGFIPKFHLIFCLILLYIMEQGEWEHD